MSNNISLLETQYENRFNESKHYRQQVWQILCNDFFSHYIPAESTVLDLGAGWGEFTRNIQAKNKYAMDLNPQCGLCVQGFADFIHQDCAMPWQLDSNSLDIVFSSNFLEHLHDKQAIEATLKEAFRCLNPGGSIILLGPNIRFIPGSYWDYWDHHVAISDQSIAEILTLTGFNVTQNIDRFLPYTMSNTRNPPLFFRSAVFKDAFCVAIPGKTISSYC